METETSHVGCVILSSRVGPTAPSAPRMRAPTAKRELLREILEASHRPRYGHAKERKPPTYFIQLNYRYPRVTLYVKAAAFLFFHVRVGAV